MKESSEMAQRSAGHTRDIGGNRSQPSGSGINRELRQSITTREAEIPTHDIDPYIFLIKQNQSKTCSQLRILKRLKNLW